MRKITLLLIFIIVIVATPLTLTKVRASDSYGYDYYNEIMAAPPAYFVDEILTPKRLGLKDNVVFRDILIKNERLYLLTKDDFYIYNLELEKRFRLDLFTTPESDEDYLFDAQSMAINGNYLYITDINPKEIKAQDKTYARSRIVIFSFLDEDGNLLDDQLRFIKNIRLSMDENIPGINERGFHPEKIAVDNSGRIYVTAKDVFQGIMELDFSGNFKKFVGTNKVNISSIEAFWRKINPSSAAGKQLFLPITFSSIAVDPSGFIYATTSSTQSKPIQKFNYKGENILIENGNTKVVGDVFEKKGVSEFVDIDINDFGVYLGLNVSQERPDQGLAARNRIFAYNDNGELLYIIGNYQANSYHYLEKPSRVRWHNEDILVVDNAGLGNRILIYKQAPYGRHINLATKYYYNGEFQKARPYWDLVMQENTNNDLAYIGIGKIYFQEANYQEALRYFKLGNNRIYYSKAYNKTRNQSLRQALPWVLGSVIVLVIIWKGYRIWKRRSQV